MIYAIFLCKNIFSFNPKKSKQLENKLQKVISKNQTQIFENGDTPK
jgi:hypothetical protein